MQHELIPYGRLRGAAAGQCGRLAARWSKLALGSLALLLCVAAAAVEMHELYTVEVPLDPGNPDARNLAYDVALSEVLVRVTGSTAVGESGQMATLFPNPLRYVSKFRSGPDNTLVISLDGPAIETVLREADASIWDSDRPLTLIWIAVDWGLGDREIVAAGDQERLPDDPRSIDRNRLLRERIMDAARHRGIPVMFPLLDTVDLENISFSDIWGGFDDLLLQASARYAAESVLVGRIRPESLLEDRWTWYHAGQRAGWYGEADEMIHRVADSLAAQFAIVGRQPFETVRLTISGIRSVRAFGQVQQLVENLRGIDAVAIDAVGGDRIVYEVQVQGGQERLQRALELSNLFDLVDPSDETAVPEGNDTPDSRGFSLEFLYRSE